MVEGESATTEQRVVGTDRSGGVGEPVAVEVFWTREQSTWAVRFVDGEGNQVGDAEFRGRKSLAVDAARKMRDPGQPIRVFTRDGDLQRVEEGTDRGRRVDEDSIEDLDDLNDRDEDFLDLRRRMAEVRAAGSVSFDRASSKNTYRFKSPAVTTDGVSEWEQVIRLDTLTNVVDRFRDRDEDIDQETAKQIVRRGLVDGEVSVDCDCPSQKWWGFEYVVTQLGSKFGQSQTIPPDERNPSTERSTCKHLAVVIEMLLDDEGGLLDDMAEALVGKIEEDSLVDRLRREDVTDIVDRRLDRRTSTT